MTKIAVLVSGGGTNLQALIDAAARDALAGGVLDFVLSSNLDAYCAAAILPMPNSMGPRLMRSFVNEISV